MTDKLMLIYTTEMNLIEAKSFPLKEYILCESSESIRSTIWESVKKFLEKLRENIINHIKSVREKIGKKVRNEKAKKDLSDIKKLIKSYDGQNIKVEFYDVWKYESVLRSTVRELNILTSAYVKKYKMIGAGLPSTNAYTKKCRSIIEKANTRLLKMQKEKITVDIKKLLDWIDKQTTKGNTEVFDFAESYLDQIKEIEQIVSQYELKAKAYADKTGMVAKPTGLTDNMKNISIFVKRNIDWIGTFALSAFIILSKNVIDSIGIEQQYQAQTATEPPRGSGSKYYNEDRIRNLSQKKFEEGDTVANKAHKTSEAITKAGTFASTGIAAEKLLSSIVSKKNSV